MKSLCLYDYEAVFNFDKALHLALDSKLEFRDIGNILFYRDVLVVLWIDSGWDSKLAKCILFISHHLDHYDVTIERCELE